MAGDGSAIAFLGHVFDNDNTRHVYRYFPATDAVAVLDPSSRLLSYPNRITAKDFEGWVQERALYMPATADPRSARLVEIHDPRDPPNRHSVLFAPVGTSA